MKKLLVALFALFATMQLSAQKFAYVDTDYILSNIPEFKKAQAELDKASADWQKEMETRYKEIENLYKAYQAESVLLTEDMKKRREEEIVERERNAKEFNKQKFGPEGELFKKRQELLKPIQDKVFNAVKELATSNQLDIMFDKSGGQGNILFSNPKFDKSDSVLRQMGVKKGVE